VFQSGHCIGLQAEPDVPLTCFQEKELVKREKSVGKEATTAAKQIAEVSKRSAELDSRESEVCQVMGPHACSMQCATQAVMQCAT